MDAMEEVAMPQSGSEAVHAVLKGKRTKRQRLLLLPSAASTSSAELSGCTTEEEEDMANCLILLAQGSRATGGAGGAEKFTSRRFAEAATTTAGKAGFYVYECKTCNKCFPSFQALGGHRASHKKAKIAAVPPEDDRKVAAGGGDGLDLSMNSFSKPFMALPINSHKPRIHECSVCGSEFSSGQALGGHMRRHRPATTSEPPDSNKERNVLSLDLNLPAPSDDERGSELPPAFAFTSKRTLVFSGSALVDCHY